MGEFDEENSKLVPFKKDHEEMSKEQLKEQLLDYADQMVEAGNFSDVIIMIIQFIHDWVVKKNNCQYNI